MAINHVRIKKKKPSAVRGNQVVPAYSPYELSQPSGDEVKQTLQPVPRSEATLEAEKGETAYVPDVQGLGAHYKIGGKRHSAGGTPLKLNDDAFIFSDTASMKIKGPILETFGKSTSGKKKSYTPAELAMQYDINKYRKILADPTSDKIMVRTAEMMIASYNKKLGALALVQEAKKGFPDGIPKIAMPFLASTGIEPSAVLPLKSPDEQEQPGDMDNEQMEQMEQEPAMARYGGFFKGRLPKHQGPPGQVGESGSMFKAAPSTLNFNTGLSNKIYDFNAGLSAQYDPSGKLMDPEYKAKLNFPNLFGQNAGANLTGSYNKNKALALKAGVGTPFLGGTLTGNVSYTKPNQSNQAPLNNAYGKPTQPVAEQYGAGIGWTGKVGNTKAVIDFNLTKAFGGVANIPDDWHHYAYGGAYGGNAFQNGPMGYGQEGGYPEDMPQQQAPDQGQGDQMQQIMEGVAQALKQGRDPKQVLQALVKMGVPMKDAVELIQQVMQGGQQGQEQEQQMQTAQYGGYPLYKAQPGVEVKYEDLDKDIAATLATSASAGKSEKERAFETKRKALAQAIKVAQWRRNELKTILSKSSNITIDPSTWFPESTRKANEADLARTVAEINEKASYYNAMGDSTNWDPAYTPPWIHAAANPTSGLKTNVYEEIKSGKRYAKPVVSLDDLTDDEFNTLTLDEQKDYIANYGKK